MAANSEAVWENYVRINSIQDRKALNYILILNFISPLY
jgi:hypothetical protein